MNWKQLNCVYLVVCFDIDIVPYIIDITLFIVSLHYIVYNTIQYFI